MLACKNALAARTTTPWEFPCSDGPFEDELVVILAVKNRGRLHARVGGLSKQQVVGRDVYVD